MISVENKLCRQLNDDMWFHEHRLYMPHHDTDTVVRLLDQQIGMPMLELRDIMTQDTIDIMSRNHEL